MTRELKGYERQKLIEYIEMITARQRWLETEGANLQLMSERDRLILEAALLGMSLDKMALIFKVTRERIRQIQGRILKDLEHVRAGHPIPGIDDVSGA